MSIGVPSLPGPGARSPGTDARGAQGVQVGQGNIQVNVYAESRSVVWPHQVGSVPIAADCYQQRDREAVRLDETESNATVVLTQVLSGLGGVGKTQLAANYARIAWANADVELLVWATATSRAAVQATYAQAAAEIGYHLPAQNVERAAEWFVGWLQTASRSWLVVLDDVADPGDLRDLWPTGASGRTVVTTRRRDAVFTERGRRLIDVGLYTATEAVAYLQDKLGAAGTDVMAEAAILAADLGYLPLALAQAATFIRDRGETCAGYRRRFGDRRRRLSEILPKDALADDYRKTVAATWSISVDRADVLAPVGLARPMLQLVSTLNPNGVPLDIVTSPAARTVIAEQRAPSASGGGPAAVEEQDCRDALTSLHRLNLISLDPAGGARAIRTHALVQRATLEGLSTDAVSVTVRAAAGALMQVWPEIERDAELGRVLRDCAASLRERHGGFLWDPIGHPMLFRAGRSLGECGLVDAAVDYWTEMVARASVTLGADHPDTLTARGDLTYWLGKAGDPAGAAAALDELLSDCLRVLGADHNHTLSTRRALIRWRGDAAGWRGEAIDSVGAVATLEQLLSDCLRVLGPDHPDTLGTRRALAYWRGEAGDSVGAVAALEQLLTEYLRVLGPDHRDTLTARGELAWLLGKAGDPAGAAAAYEQLLIDRLRVLGADHNHTLGTRSVLGHWRGEAGNPVGAVAALEELLTDCLRVLGPDHPDTLTARLDLAYWRGEAGDPSGATVALEQLLIDRGRVLGADHPATLRLRGNLGWSRGAAGDPAGAVATLEQLLTDYLRMLGPDHPDTLTARGDLAHWRGKAGDFAGAAAAYEQLLTDRLRVLGADHNHTRGTRRALASSRGEAGDPVGAVAASEQLLNDCLRVLGPDHPDTLAARGDLAYWRGQAGDAECND